MDNKIYLKEFKKYIKEVLSTKDLTKNFLVRAGINTPKGKLTKRYKK